MKYLRVELTELLLYNINVNFSGICELMDSFTDDPQFEERFKKILPKYTKKLWKFLLTQPDLLSAYTCNRKGFWFTSYNVEPRKELLKRYLNHLKSK